MSGALNLLILGNSKTEKNHKNAEVRYTAGTRNDPTARNVRTRMSVQEEIDRLRDAHRRTGLAVVRQLLRDDSYLTRGRLVLCLLTEMRNTEWFEAMSLLSG